jgi:hypothetical protein
MATWQSQLVNIILIALGICIIFLVLRYLLIRKKFSKPSNKISLFKTKSKSSYEPLESIKVISGSVINFEKKLYEKESSIGLILGARGSGKSALGLKISENFSAQTKKQICAIGFSKKDLPNWINVIEDPEQLPNDSFVLIDEGGILLSSRDSMKDTNKIVSKILFVARHKNLSILFITQNSSNIDINTIRQTDYLLLKPSSLLQLDFERKKIKDIYEEVGKDFEKLKNEPGLFYIYSDDFKGFASNNLPSFWSKKISKTYENKKIEE